MTILSIRQKLHQFIDAMEDEKAAAMYALLSIETDTDSQRKKLILAERARHLKGEGKLYSRSEVKEMATNKSKRRAL